jgi:hypothetical protein
LELRHKVEIHNLTGRVLECPWAEMDRPRASVDPQLRVPPRAEVEQLFAGWCEELVSCHKFAPPARNYAVTRLATNVGVRINEARMLDLDDVRWELGRFGKLNVRHDKGSVAGGPKPRLVPLISGADRSLRWFILRWFIRTCRASSTPTTPGRGDPCHSLPHADQSANVCQVYRISGALLTSLPSRSVSAVPSRPG